MTRSSVVFAAVLTTTAGIGAPCLAGDFDGGYVGVVTAFGSDPVPRNTSPDHSLGAVAGYNFGIGQSTIAGVEIEANQNPDSVWGLQVFTGEVHGRAGFVFADDFMAYGRVGTGYTFGGDGSFLWSFGGGVEYQVKEGVSVRGDAGRVDPLADGLISQNAFRMGVLLNF